MPEFGQIVFFASIVGSWGLGVLLLWSAGELS
jgi:hypothetical protein